LKYNQGILIGKLRMPIKPPLSIGPESHGKSFEQFSNVSLRAKDTIKRVRGYMNGRHSDEPASLLSEAQTLTTQDWHAAIPRHRNNGKLIFRDSSSMEQSPDKGPDPFDLAYGRELVARLEAQLPPEQVPFLDAFLAGDKPRDIADRLGITAKAASARMRRFKAKVVALYGTLVQN
jgi:hypothetical protein